MNSSEVIKRASAGALEPVYLVVGTEGLLIERVVDAVRRAVDDVGIQGFNVDVYDGGQVDATRVISSARTLPMMAERRLVLLRHVDAMTPTEQSRLVDYVQAPSESTCLVLTAEKLDGRGKLIKAAKARGSLVEAKPIRGRELRAFVRAEADARDHKISSDAVEALLEATGDDLAAIEDGVERLSLFVGQGEPIEVDSVTTCVSRARVESIWSLVDAIGLRDRKTVVGAAQSLLADREPPLRLLAMVARQLRIVARMRTALAEGLSPQEATKRAGAPPFKARELTKSARLFSSSNLGRAFSVLAETDRALKSSKRPPDAVFQEAVLTLCVDEE